MCAYYYFMGFANCFLCFRGDLTRGATVIDWMERTKEKNVTIVLEMDQDKYLDFLLESLDYPIKY